MNIESLIEQGENQAVEFKSDGVRAESLAKEIVAFANSGGGSILVGVEDDGRITGLDNSKAFPDWIANITRNNVNPPLDSVVNLISIKGKAVGVIDVPKGKDKPYQTNNAQFLIRIGATNRVASINELMRLFQQAGVFHFDATSVNKTSLSNLNFSSLDKYLAQYSIDFSSEDDRATLLGNMDIMQGDLLTVSGLLMFGINPQKFMDNACISYAHYNGTEIGDELIDKQVIEGTLPEQIDKALVVLKNNIKKPSKIEGGKRSDNPEQYSDKVLRELIVNAVIHRNYSIMGSRIRIFQFDDRLEFISPGRLPNTISIEKLRYGVSYASNPVILKFLENMRYADKLGRGLPLVYQEAKRLGKKVTFEEIGEEFKVTLVL